MTRSLRPSTLVTTFDAVWALDGFQPVAARLDPADGTVLGVVAWPELAAPPPGRNRSPVTAGAHIWVQYGEVLARLGEGGVRQTEAVPSLSLLIAGGPGAWLAEVPHIAVGERDSDGTWRPPPLPPIGRMVMASPDGDRRELLLDRPVRTLGADPDGLLVTVSERPPEAITEGRGERFDYHRVTFRLPWSDLPTRPISCIDRTPVTPPHPTALVSLAANPGDRWSVGGLWFGGLWWSAGCDVSGPRAERPLVAVGVDSDGTERARVPLGTGDVCARLRVGDHIWFTLRHGRRQHVDFGDPVEIVAFCPHSREVTQVLAGDSVDITGRGWPLQPEPPGSVEHARRWWSRFNTFDVYGRDQTGATRPLAYGMTDVHASLEGTWPDRAVRVTFRHPHYPDGLLSRRIPLFDELGRAIDPEYADIGLMEDLDTRFLPPITEARDGVLAI